MTTNLPGASIMQFPNPDLRWEKVGIVNIGIDFASVKNIISGSIEWYEKKGIDLFGATNVDITAGLGQNSLITNIADMKGSGFDVVLNTVNTKGKFNWNTGIIFNYNTDKVTKAYLTTSNASRYLNDGNGITAMVGRPVHSIISYKWGGLTHDTGDPQGYIDRNLSTDYGTITGSGTSIGDLEYSGPALPQFFGSITNSFGWKRLQVSININYKFHYFFKRHALIYGDLFEGNDRKSSADFALRWKNPGDELVTNVPSMVYPYNSSRDYFYASSAAMVERGDNVRLQFITFSYLLPMQKKGSVKSIRFYLNASNLGIIWRANNMGLDPDYAVTNIPPSGTYAFGVKISFQ